MLCITPVSWPACSRWFSLEASPLGWAGNADWCGDKRAPLLLASTTSGLPAPHGKLRAVQIVLKLPSRLVVGALPRFHLASWPLDASGTIAGNGTITSPQTLTKVTVNVVLCNMSSYICKCSVWTPDTWLEWLSFSHYPLNSQALQEMHQNLLLSVYFAYGS